jgi:hypothetical protein
VVSSYNNISEGLDITLDVQIGEELSSIFPLENKPIVRLWDSKPISAINRRPGLR